ncbi:hypothetical protein Q1695_001735 [Nippostrongylus brasiliensis]|nr:hypothetical protein Q1695_001735 [Nippostrongylus brasiliensis]
MFANRSQRMPEVSSDILRVSGYTQQFRSLLTARFSTRRDSVPNLHLESENDEKADDPSRMFSLKPQRTYIVQILPALFQRHGNLRLIVDWATSCQEALLICGWSQIPERSIA